jgi:hypothetical protein
MFELKIIKFLCLRRLESLILLIIYKKMRTHLVIFEGIYAL